MHFHHENGCIYVAVSSFQVLCGIYSTLGCKKDRCKASSFGLLANYVCKFLHMFAIKCYCSCVIIGTSCHRSVHWVVMFAVHPGRLVRRVLIRPPGISCQGATRGSPCSYQAKVHKIRAGGHSVRYTQKCTRCTVKYTSCVVLRRCMQTHTRPVTITPRQQKNSQPAAVFVWSSY